MQKNGGLNSETARVYSIWGLAPLPRQRRFPCYIRTIGTAIRQMLPTLSACSGEFNYNKRRNGKRLCDNHGLPTPLCQVSHHVERANSLLLPGHAKFNFASCTSTEVQQR